MIPFHEQIVLSYDQENDDTLSIVQFYDCEKWSSWCSQKDWMNTLRGRNEITRALLDVNQKNLPAITATKTEQENCWRRTGNRICDKNFHPNQRKRGSLSNNVSLKMMVMVRVWDILWRWIHSTTWMTWKHCTELRERALLLQESFYFGFCSPLFTAHIKIKRYIDVALAWPMQT